MKKQFIILVLAILANCTLQAQSYDFQSGELLYTIISTDPPRVSVDGHIDGQAAQGELIIPETVQYANSTYTVTEIGKEAFYDCNGLTGNLILPNTIDTIRNSAFRGCGSLVGDLVLPNSIRFIGASAFRGCYGLEGSLSLPNTLSVISYGTFRGCGFSGSLSIPNSVVEIWAEAFYGCSGFTGNLVIPNSVVRLNVNSHTGNTILGSFEECTGFTRLLLSDALEIIDDGAGGGCFAGCSNIGGTLVLPESLTYIGTSAFWRCTGISGSLFIPKAVTYIGAYAFEGCTGLGEKLDVPDSVLDINVHAFGGCGFKRLSLGNAIETIGAWAFSDNPLEMISITALTPPILGNEHYGTFPVFNNVSKEIPVYIPCGTEVIYRGAHEWGDFTNYVELMNISLMVVSEDDAIGTVCILKEATCEDPTAVVEAIPNEGYAFLCWETNGEQISIDNPYSFELLEDTELVAHFSGTGVVETEGKFTVHPNPTTGTVAITGENIRQAEITNLWGQHFFTATGEGNEIRIDMAKLPSGVYFVNITDEEGRKCVRKVVKE